MKWWTVAGLGISLMLLNKAPVLAVTGGVTVGVTRWDTWNRSWPAFQFDAFKPEKYHYRLPFYSYVRDDGNVEMSEDKQEIIDREILYADKAGIDYWNFGWYEPKNLSNPDATFDFTYGLRFYLSSQYVKKVNFSLMFMGPGGKGSNMGDPSDWKTKIVPKFIEYVKEPTYQKVLGGRPIIYFIKPQYLTGHFGGGTKGKEQIAYLRNKVKEAVGKDPYMVGVPWPFGVVDEADLKVIYDLGVDAVTNYLQTGVGCKSKPCPFSTMVNVSSTFGSVQQKAGHEIITPVTVGVNDDPRYFWQNPTATKNDGIVAVQDGTEAEISKTIANSVNWTRDNKQTVPAQSVLVYAWNELAEGGWLLPGLTAGDKNLRGVAGGLGVKYPEKLVANVKRVGTKLVLKVNGAVPVGATVQLYDRGSVLWGPKIELKGSAGSYTVDIPSLNPPSKCNRLKVCSITADIFDAKSNFLEMINMDLPVVLASQITPTKIPTNLPTKQPTLILTSKPTAIQNTPTDPAQKKADFNNDGEVDILDYSLWYKEFYDGNKGGIAKATWQSDVTGAEGERDNKVDIVDYSLWYKQSFDK